MHIDMVSKEGKRECRAFKVSYKPGLLTWYITARNNDRIRRTFPFILINPSAKL